MYSSLHCMGLCSWCPCCRYEDNFDTINCLAVLVESSDKSSIEEYGNEEAFLNKVSYLLGQQSFEGEAIIPHVSAPRNQGSAVASCFLEC